MPSLPETNPAGPSHSRALSPPPTRLERHASTSSARVDPRAAARVDPRAAARVDPRPRATSRTTPAPARRHPQPRRGWYWGWLAFPWCWPFLRDARIGAVRARKASRVPLGSASTMSRHPPQSKIKNLSSALSSAHGPRMEMSSLLLAAAQS